jgi:multidrug efflux system membrane fusion protein
VQPGMTADLVFTDHPGKHFTAEVASTARALDASSRTLQVELQIDNSRGELFPGSYADVHFTFPANTTTLRVPVNTVLFRAQGLLVAVLDSQGRVRLRHITQGRDFGTQIEVLSGLEPTDRLILNPPDSITEDTRVRVVPAAPIAGTAAAGRS